MTSSLSIPAGGTPQTQSAAPSQNQNSSSAIPAGGGVHLPAGEEEPDTPGGAPQVVSSLTSGSPYSSMTSSQSAPAGGGVHLPAGEEESDAPGGAPHPAPVVPTPEDSGGGGQGGGEKKRSQNLQRPK